jgi:hypothetical protein
MQLSVKHLVWGGGRAGSLRCAVLTLAAAVTFVTGLILPFVQVAPGEKLPPIPGLIIWFLSDDDTYSLFGSIVAIWEEDRFLGGIAFLFSLALPCVKLVALSYCALIVGRNAQGTSLYRTWAERLGPWSMLEVFLVSLTLLLTKSLPFGTAVHPLTGFYFFWVSILLSLIAAWTLPKAEPIANADKGSTVEGKDEKVDDGALPLPLASSTEPAIPLGGTSCPSQRGDDNCQTDEPTGARHRGFSSFDMLADGPGS